MKNKKNKIVEFLNYSGNKTIRVMTKKRQMHPRYKKFINKTFKYLVHFDSEISLHKGDKVLVKDCRPISKNKSLVFVRKYNKLEDKKWYKQKLC